MSRTRDKIRFALRRLSSRGYRVGDHTITLPAGHRLDLYQALYRNYDKKLPAIAAALYRKYREMVVIDIGANVGDTLAALRTIGDFPVVCVEGSPAFLPYLEKNMRAIGGENFLSSCLIGCSNGTVATSALTASAGTARVIEATSFSDTSSPRRATEVPVRTLLEVVMERHSPENVRLIKTDTDGSDFDIIACNRTLFQRSGASIFFEFDPYLAQGRSTTWTDAIKTLLDTERSQFLVYDNFGNLMTTVVAEPLRRFAELAHFLASTRTHGGGIDYLDVLALHRNDMDIFESLALAEIGD